MHPILFRIGSFEIGSYGLLMALSFFAAVGLSKRLAKRDGVDPEHISDLAIVNPDDARSSLVQLTPEGLALIDRAVEAHVANAHRILAPLKAADLAALDARLALLLAALESPTGQ